MSDQKTDKLISRSDAQALILAHDSDCALLHLWMVLTGSLDFERAARDLCMTRAQVDSAAEKLNRMLLSAPSAAVDIPDSGALGSFDRKKGSDAPPKIIPPADEFPTYTASEIDACFRDDSGFRAILSECEQLFGKQLSRHDMGRLLGIYNHLGLPAEVIFVLLHYCADVSRGPSGAERKPTMRFIEQQAYIWVNREITTMEAAEEYVERQKALLESEKRISHILEIYDRKLTSDEKSFISSWLANGFSDDAVSLAYERCINNIGKRSFSYINSILNSWHEAGIHSASEAEARDPGKGRKGGSSDKNNVGRPERIFIPTEF